MACISSNFPMTGSVAVLVMQGICVINAVRKAFKTYWVEYTACFSHLEIGRSESELLQYRSSVRFSSKDHFKASIILIQHIVGLIFIPPPNEVGGVILESPWPSVCLSVCPSVCRRHDFRSVTKVFFGISISNFICMLFVAIGRSLLIFSDVNIKMAAWWPYWIFRFPDSNFSLALKSSPNFTGTSLVCMERSLLISAMSLLKWPPGGHIGFVSIWTL